VTALHAAAFEAIGTTAQVVVTDPAALPAARALLMRELDELDRAASRFRPDSELTLLNQARGRTRQVSPLLLEALSVAVCAAEQTDGIVSPMVGRTLRLAGYDTTFALVASREGRRFAPQFAAVADWRLLELDEERRTARIPPGVELDLGATAKALAADRAAARIADAASCGALVSLGGDISVAGAAPPGGWAIRVADHHASPPDGAGPAIAVKSGGLATSSTAARRWRTANGELHHVVDPRTGRPARTPWQTVTVAAATCVDANTASTTALVLGEEAVEWLESRGLPARIVATDGSTVCTGGWSPELA
jgi:thiamine biosynthesis lipoprotein